MNPRSTPQLTRGELRDLRDRACDRAADRAAERSARREAWLVALAIYAVPLIGWFA